MNHTLSAGLRAGLLAGLATLGCAAVHAQNAEGCTLQKQVYTCDRAGFRQALAKAATAEVDPAAKDRMVAAKLRDLVTTLGKAAPGPGQPADLTFSLLPVESTGVMVGPAGVELAVLRVFGPAARTGSASGGTGALLWAETFSGQPDTSWPATVQATINQFRAGFKR